LDGIRLTIDGSRPAGEVSRFKTSIDQIRGCGLNERRKQEGDTKTDMFSQAFPLKNAFQNDTDRSYRRQT
jgi:hypothetical protein